MRAAGLLMLAAMSVSPAVQPAAPVATARITFTADRVQEVELHGYADRDAGRLLTADDPVRVASLSKLVVAIAAMRLVEQGRLDLDADVARYLGWPLRHPRWPDVPITLRWLLSHRAGLTDAAGYWQVPLGEPFALLLQDPRAWDSEHAPGTFWRYANVGYPLVAAVMERVTGERFDLLMQRLVLGPLQISACYNWASCDAATQRRAVVLYEDGRAVRDDLRGLPPACAVNAAADGSCDLGRWRVGEQGALFAPQGGLRISILGLAKIGRLLLGEGAVDGVRLLTPASIRSMIAPQWTFLPGNGLGYEEDETTGVPAANQLCRYGLAVQTLATSRAGCGDDLFGDGVARVGHAGNAYGLRSGLWLDTRRGEGVAYFATGVAGNAGTHSAFSDVEERLALGKSQPASGLP